MWQVFKLCIFHRVQCGTIRNLQGIYIVHDSIIKPDLTPLASASCVHIYKSLLLESYIPIIHVLGSISFRIALSHLFFFCISTWYMGSLPILIMRDRRSLACSSTDPILHNLHLWAVAASLLPFHNYVTESHFHMPSKFQGLHDNFLEHFSQTSTQVHWHKLITFCSLGSIHYGKVNKPLPIENTCQCWWMVFLDHIHLVWRQLVLEHPPKIKEEKSQSICL